MKIYCYDKTNWRDRKSKINNLYDSGSSRYQEELFKVNIMRLAGKDLWMLVECKGKGISSQYTPCFIQVKCVEPSGMSIIADILSYYSCDGTGRYSRERIQPDKWIGLGSIQPISSKRSMKERDLLLTSEELFDEYIREDFRRHN